MLLKQLIKAEEIECEDFCVAVINQTFGYQNAPDDDSNPWLAFLADGVPRNKDNWNDFIRIINEKKPLEDEDMKLDKLYMKGSKGIGVKFIQKVVNKYMGSNLMIDGIWGNLTEAGVRAFQEAKGLLVDGKVGIETFPAMIEEYPNIWNQIQYAWAIGVR